MDECRRLKEESWTCELCASAQENESTVVGENDEGIKTYRVEHNHIKK